MTRIIKARYQSIVSVCGGGGVCVCGGGGGGGGLHVAKSILHTWIPVFQESSPWPYLPVVTQGKIRAHLAALLIRNKPITNHVIVL